MDRVVFLTGVLPLHYIKMHINCRSYWISPVSPVFLFSLIKLQYSVNNIIFLLKNLITLFNISRPVITKQHVLCIDFCETGLFRMYRRDEL